MRLGGGYHPPIPLTVAYLAIFVTTGDGRQLRLPPADRPCPRPINVVMPVEEFGRGYDR
jgi:hypothetical protein